MSEATNRLDAKQALDKLATWLEEQDREWRGHSMTVEEDRTREYWRGHANAFKDTAQQVRGLLYELSNPPPSGPWDSQGHMDSENADWAADHPLTQRDEDGNEWMDGAFYR